jgi:hypothetical protein
VEFGKTGGDRETIAHESGFILVDNTAEANREAVPVEED